jgi:hypothetical protein
MVEHLRLMRPVWVADVWVAEESNPPLLRSDARLGFVPVDEIIVFHPPRGQDSDAALR